MVFSDASIYIYWRLSFVHGTIMAFYSTIGFPLWYSVQLYYWFSLVAFYSIMVFLRTIFRLAIGIRRWQCSLVFPCYVESNPAVFFFQRMQLVLRTEVVAFRSYVSLIISYPSSIYLDFNFASIFAYSYSRGHAPHIHGMDIAILTGIDMVFQPIFHSASTDFS